jgi:hypothetical protein
MNILSSLISKYALDYPTKLLDWIPKKYINWSHLSANSAAIYLLEKNPNKIDWDMLSKNTHAIYLLKIYIYIYIYIYIKLIGNIYL